MEHDDAFVVGADTSQELEEFRARVAMLIHHHFDLRDFDPERDWGLVPDVPPVAVAINRVEQITGLVFGQALPNYNGYAFHLPIPWILP